jgi:internalin A
MPTDLEILKELEKELGIELREIKGIVRGDESGRKTDANQNVVGLSLYAAGLRALPPEIGQLQNLIELDLSRNQLSTLPPEIGQLQNLTALDLWSNQLSALPPEIGQLQNLTALDLWSNQLSALPPEIGQLQNLIELDLSRNQLSALPPEIGQLQNLTRLYLGYNPLKQLPPEIVKQGIAAIFEYLHQLPVEEIRAVVNEAKLILVGQGDVGKTCLAKRMIFDTFQEEKSTEGIDILEWSITSPTSEQEEIKLNVWDFGGQEIYHATHQLFLTKRSVYLLVWNARKSRDYEHIYYWLHTIEAFGEDSPIILVMSKCNERDDDLNMRDLREKFPQIVGLYKVDSEDGKGIPSLKEILSQTTWHLPHMRTPWIESWFAVRARLEQDGRDWVEYKEFHEICKAEGLDYKQVDILDEYLHDLGVIIHFRDKLGLLNMVILKPEWATSAIYKILDTQKVRDRAGVLLHSELGKIWDTSIYPQDVHPQLLELMNKFELAYELLDEERHLVAELLPSTEPEFAWDDTDNLRFYYRYDFLPAGVMTCFIVLLHQDLEYKSDGTHLCWREGAVLRREGTRALVKVNPLAKLIAIKIQGSKKRELLAIIRHQFDHINRSIKKVKITEEIPCNCSEGCSKTYDYNKLIAGEQKGITDIQCDNSWETISLSQLLDGYVTKEKRKKEYSFEPKIEVKTDIDVVTTTTTTINIDIRIDLPEIQSDFQKFKREVSKLDPELKEELDDIEGDLLEITPKSEQGKINKAMNKLSSFMQELDVKNSKYHKLISGTKKGIEGAQKLGKTYNKFAQWLTLPQVPDLFLGNQQ